MNYKKSMRIFWISLCLLLVSGTLIIVAVQYRSYKKQPDDFYDGQEDMEPAFRVRDAQTDADADDAADGPEVPYTEQKDTAVSAQIHLADSDTSQYRFELRLRDGYADVYYFGTEQLYFHTGIPYSALTAEQRQELENGKYFADEQELYGYLESCTS